LVRALQGNGPSFERVAAEFEPEVRFLKVDTEAERDLANRYEIRSIPTLIMFQKGKIVAQRAGASDVPIPACVYSAEHGSIARKHGLMRVRIYESGHRQGTDLPFS
jgi:hypothetical protein